MTNPRDYPNAQQICVAGQCKNCHKDVTYEVAGGETTLVHMETLDPNCGMVAELEQDVREP